MAARPRPEQPERRKRVVGGTMFESRKAIPSLRLVRRVSHAWQLPVRQRAVHSMKQSIRHADASEQLLYDGSTTMTSHYTDDADSQVILSLLMPRTRYGSPCESRLWSWCLQATCQICCDVMI